LATAERSTFSISFAAALSEGEHRPRLGHAAPADVLHDEPRFAGRHAHPLRLGAYFLLLDRRWH
jgi:hypothetical protein